MAARGAAQVGALPPAPPRRPGPADRGRCRLGLPGGHGPPVPAHSHPGAAERGADGGRAAEEESRRCVATGGGSGRSRLRAARPPLLGGPGLQGARRLPPGDAARAVRPRIRQRGVGAGPRRSERRRAVTVRISHHPPAAARASAGLVPHADRRLEQIDSAGVRLTADDWRHVRAEHDSGVGRLEGLLRLSPQLLKDSAATLDARVRLAMAHMEGYLDAAVTQATAPFLPVPPFLAAALRRGEPWSLNDAGIARAVERAQAIRAADTTARQTPGTGLKRAPGPPPIGGDSAAKRTPS